MRKSSLSTAAAAAVIGLVVVTAVSAASFTLGPLVQVSATSPFPAGCDGFADQSGEAVLNSEVEPWIDVNPIEPDQHRRDLAAGPLVERRRPRARRRRQHERRHELDVCHDSEDDLCTGGHGWRTAAATSGRPTRGSRSGRPGSSTS